MVIHSGLPGTRWFTIKRAEPDEPHAYDCLWVGEATFPAGVEGQHQISIGINDENNNLPASTVAGYLVAVGMAVGAAFPTAVEGQTHELPDGGAIRLGVQDTEYDVDFDGDADAQIRYDVNLIGARAEDIEMLLVLRDSIQEALAAAFPLD